jgi:hypothetical protein
VFLQRLRHGGNTGSGCQFVALGHTLVHGVLKLTSVAHGETHLVGAYPGFMDGNRSRVDRFMTTANAKSGRDRKRRMVRMLENDMESTNFVRGRELIRPTFTRKKEKWQAMDGNGCP